MATDQQTRKKIDAYLREREGLQQRLDRGAGDPEWLKGSIDAVNEALKTLGYKEPTSKKGTSSKKKESKD